MKRFLVLWVIVLCCVSLVALAETPVYTVTMTGEGVVAATPDQVEISCTVAVTSKSARAAISDQALKTRILMAVAKSNDIPETQVSTQSYSFQEVWEADKDGSNRRRTGYTVTQRVIICAPIGKGGVLLDMLSNNALIDRVRFTISNADELREKATALAITAAKDKAALRAKQLGVTLGSILSFQESRSNPYEVRMNMTETTRSMATPHLPAGETDIRSTVTITYELLTK